MIENTPSTLDLPLLPVGIGDTPQRVFALAASTLAETSEPETGGASGESPLHAAQTRREGREGRERVSRLEEQLLKVPFAPVPLGDYDVIRRIGAGGMGVVYEAVHRGRAQRVALKTLRHMNATALYHFKNEFRGAQSLVHPNLCALYELVSQDGAWFFTMEYLDGVSFLEHVRGAPPRAGEGEATAPGGFDEARLRSALREVARGVRALHEAGKLHRDINPSNVIVTREGRVVILDFGLIGSAVQGGASAFGGAVGTPGYMAPEQASGEPATEASDWYAVGVMLYEALTGRLPFTGSVSRVLIAKRTMAPTPPSALVARVPQDLEGLCLRLLQRAPAARPAGHEVLRCLGAVPPTAPDPRDRHAGRRELIGRDAELEALRRAFAAVAPGRPVIARVEGRSGIGKTRLVKHFLAALAEEGQALVLRGRCYERESVPYKAFDSLVDALAQHLRALPEEAAAALLPQEFIELARVFPVLEGVPARESVPPRRFDVRDPQEVRRRAFIGLKEILRRLATARPLVLAIDDLQWGDLDSARLLTELVSPPGAPGILVILVCRSEEAERSPVLAELLSPRGAAGRAAVLSEVRVEALDREHAVALALRYVGAHGPEVRAIAEAIAHEAEGNPFLISTLHRYAEEARLGAQARGSLEQIVAARIARLTPEARLLLELTAVAARPLEQGVLLAAAASGPDGPHALVHLGKSRLLRAQGSHDGDRVEIYHDRLREAVVAQLSPEALRDRHLRLARALVARKSVGPEVLAAHFHGAGQLDRAAAYAESAAAQAEAALAFDRAAELYRAALDWGPSDARRSASLLEKRANALVNAGRGAEAASLFLAAVARLPAAEARDLERRAAEQLLVTGHVDEGIGALCPVLRAHGISYPKTPLRALWMLKNRLLLLRLRGTRFRRRHAGRISPQARARIDACWAAARGLGAVDPLRSAVYVLEALRLALDAGYIPRIVTGLASVGSAILYEGTAGAVARGEALIAEAERLAARTEDPYLIGYTENTRGLASMCVGRWRDALACMEEGSKLLADRCVGAHWERNVGRSVAIQALLALGEIEERTRRAHALLREADAVGDVYAAVDAALYLALARVAADDTRGARAEVQAAIGRWSRRGFYFQHHVAWLTEAWCDLYDGEPGRAFRRAEAAFPLLRRSSILHVQLMRIEALTARGMSAAALSAFAPRERARLLRRARTDAARLEREGRPHAAAAAAVIRGSVALREGAWIGAAEHLRAAAALYDGAEMKLHAACARRYLGLLEGGEDGRALVAEADAALRAEGIAAPERWARMYTGIVWMR